MFDHLIGRPTCIGYYVDTKYVKQRHTIEIYCNIAKCDFLMPTLFCIGMKIKIFQTFFNVLCSVLYNKSELERAVDVGKRASRGSSMGNQISN